MPQSDLETENAVLKDVVQRLRMDLAASGRALYNCGVECNSLRGMAAEAVRRKNDVDVVCSILESELV